MRVKLGKTIRRCKFITIFENINMLHVSTDNGLYAVRVPEVVDINKLHHQILVQGYADLSDYEYSNA